MAIAIVVEDGSGANPQANAYISVDDVRDFASLRGVDLGDDDDSIAAYIIKATDYIESFANQWMGCQTFIDQPLSWPRAMVYFNNSELPFDSNTIPKNLKSATSLLCIIQNDGLVLQPNITASDYVTEETVGPITTKYANPNTVGIYPQFPGVDSVLLPLMASQSFSMRLQTIRV